MNSVKSTKQYRIGHCYDVIACSEREDYTGEKINRKTSLQDAA